MYFSPFHIYGLTQPLPSHNQAHNIWCCVKNTEPSLSNFPRLLLLRNVTRLSTKLSIMYRSRYARMVLPLARPVPLGIHTSYNALWSRVSSDLQQIVMNQLSYEGSLDATNLYYRYTQRLGGLSRVPFQVG